MPKKLTIIIPSALLLLIVALLIGSQFAGTVSRKDMTLNLDMGNNDGSSTVYDSSGFSRNATSTGSGLVISDDYVEFDGSTNHYLELDSTDVFNTANISVAVKFTPDFAAANNGIGRNFFESKASERYLLNQGSTGLLNLYLGETSIAAVAIETYSPYWKTGEENVIVIRGTSGNTDAWLNGNAILTNDSSAWTPANPTNTRIGINASLGGSFDGKIHYLKIWNRLLTDDEVQNISADRKSSSNSTTRGNASSSLVHYWTMDANDINGTTVYDKGNVRQNGTADATPTIVAGKVGQAIDFNGSSDYIDADGCEFLYDSLTVCAWVYPDSAVLSGDYEILRMRTATNLDSFSLRVRDGDWGIHDGTTLRASTTPYLAPNQWYHICGKLQKRGTGDNDYHIYVNGQLGVAQTGKNYSPVASSSKCKIGSDSTGSSSNWDGKIDELKVWNYALTEAEIGNEYKSEHRNYSYTAPRTGLVGYWTMDANDLNVSTIYDKSGKGKHATGVNLTSADITGGKIKEAMDFDPADSEYANLPLTAWPGNDGTLCMWIKAESFAGNTRVWSTNHSLGPSYEHRTFRNGLYFYTYFSNGSDTTEIHATTGYSLNNWYHYCFTWDYDGSAQTAIKQYGNSVLAEADVISGTLSVPDTSFQLGAWGGANFYDGQIDEVRLYNRALTAQEVDQLYRATRRYVR